MLSGLSRLLSLCMSNPSPCKFVSNIKCENSNVVIDHLSFFGAQGDGFHYIDLIAEWMMVCYCFSWSDWPCSFMFQPHLIGGSRDRMSSVPFHIYILMWSDNTLKGLAIKKLFEQIVSHLIVYCCLVIDTDCSDIHFLQAHCLRSWFTKFWIFNSQPSTAPHHD